MRAKNCLSVFLALCLTLTPIFAAAPEQRDAESGTVAETLTESASAEISTESADAETAPDETETPDEENALDELGTSDAPEEVAQLLDGDDAPTSGTCGNNLTWALDAEGTLTISGEGAMTNYTVRNSVANTPWYALRTGITSVVISSGATSIGSYAFRNCSAMTRITIPASVTTIGGGAFYDCDALTEVSIPASVTTIGESVFYSCSRLEKAAIPNGITSISKNTFYDCDALTEVSIPASVTEIGASAFFDCDALTEVSIPASVTTIGESAFYSCNKLEKVSIPNGVTSISKSAFSSCSALTSVAIPASVTEIGEYAFYQCSALPSVTIPASVTKIGQFAFSKCTGLTSVTIPASVAELGNSAFSGCTGLTEVVLSNGVGAIGESAFSGCTALSSVSIPASVTEIPGSAFSGCVALSAMQVDAQNPRFSSEDGILFSKAKTELIRYPVGKTNTDYVVPRYVRQIAASALSGCSNLERVIIAQGVASIGESAFENCAALEEVSLPESLTSIGKQAFANCKALKEITIPGGVTEVGSSAFSDCAALTAAKISDGASVIGNSMFFRCTALTEIKIPASVAEIGEYAFDQCTSLTEITIPSGVTSIGRSAFYGCTMLTEIVIPGSVETVSSRAFADCTGLTSVTIAKGVTKIESDVFSGCTKLTELTIPASVTSFSTSGLPATLTAIHVAGGGEAYSGRDGVLMSGDRTSVLYYPRGKENESWIVPDGVTAIGASAFSACRTLKAVTLPNGLESIGNNAFYDCESLSAINFPDGLKSIGNNAFQYCYALESVKLPDSVESVGQGSFYYCVSLSDATLSAGLTKLPDSLFYHCFHLPCLVIPEGVTSVSSNCFSLCENLAKIAIPQGATGFAAALSACDSLTDIYYGGGEEMWKEAIGDTELTATVHLNAYEEGKTQCVRKNPVMALTKVPVYGNGSNFEGVVFREDGAELAASSYRVTLYVQSGDAYFIKPTAAEPFVNLKSDGRFSIWYTSGGVPDSRATRIHLLLLSATYTPVGDFETDKAAALDYVLVTRTMEGGTEVSPNRETAAKSQAPRIALTYCPVYGKREQFQGKVYAPDGSELNPKDYRISLYLQTALGGTYWVKPYWDTPYASVKDDCTFSISYLTGGIDGTAVSIHIMLIPGDFTPYTDKKTYADTVAAALDYVHVGRDAMGGVRVSPTRQLPGQVDDDDIGPGIPLNLPIEEDKIAVDVGFYTGGSKPGDALSVDIIRAQLQAVARFSNVVRFYGASGELYKAYEIAHSMGLTVLGGAWLSGDEAADKAEMDALIEHCNKGYAKLAIVGSETQLRRQSKPQAQNVSMETLLADIAYVRAGLKNKSVPVTTADSIDILRSSLPLRKACDLIMPNCYPYFNSVSNEDAAADFAVAMDSLRSVCGEKEIIVSETGWATAGDDKGAAKVGGAEAAAYFTAIREWSVKNNTQVLFFEATDEAWKKADEGEVGGNWGFMTNNFAVKPDYAKVSPFSGISPHSDYAVEYDGSTKTSTAVSLTNHLGATADVTFIVAAYASNGRMVSCGITSKSIGIEESVTASVSYKSDADVSVVKAFVLSMDALMPLRDAWTRNLT